VLRSDGIGSRGEVLEIINAFNASSTGKDDSE
jgi:hypothetical protein